MLDVDEKSAAEHTLPPGSPRSDSSPQLEKELEASYTNSRREPSISRSRSNNGYGCDEGTEDNAVAVSENDCEGEAEPTSDPFEVHWDGGDEDPMNPRSFSMARKWLVVLIVSASSMCV